jgi:hypothetical protein
MDEPPIINEPPVIIEPPRLPSRRRQRSALEQAALFSVIAPVAAIGLGIIGQGAMRDRLGSMILGCTTTFLILSGCVCGIVAFIVANKRGKKDIRRQAALGTCISGGLVLLILAALPGLMKTIERAKQIQRQRIDQRDR